MKITPRKLCRSIDHGHSFSIKFTFYSRNEGWITVDIDNTSHLLVAAIRAEIARRNK